MSDYDIVTIQFDGENFWDVADFIGGWDESSVPTKPHAGWLDHDNNPTTDPGETPDSDVVVLIVPTLDGDKVCAPGDWLTLDGSGRYGVYKPPPAAEQVQL